jgi:hypothetical protein
MRRITAVRLAAALVAAAFPLPGASAATSPTRPFLRTGISFRYPSAWTASPAAWDAHPSTFTVPVAWMSPQPMRDPCPKRATSVDCGTAVKAVRPGGVLLTVSEVSMPGLDVRRGSLILLGDRTSYLLVTHPGWCSSVRGDETMEASIPVTDDSAYLVDACLRQPTAANEQRVRDLLETIRLH